MQSKTDMLAQIDCVLKLKDDEPSVPMNYSSSGKDDPSTVFLLGVDDRSGRRAAFGFDPEPSLPGAVALEQLLTTV